MTGYCITEGVESTWRYHWSVRGSPTRALCGAATMQTSMRPDQWGTTGHLHERYCSTCVERKTKEEEIP